MKKQSLSILCVLTLLFCAFTLGFFLGRNQNRETIYLSQIFTSPRHDIPLQTQTAPSPTGKTIPFPIDINSATLQELTALPGIGETLAQRILDYRSAHGRFSRPEELMRVEGIGAGKLEAILDYVTTGG